MTAQLHHFSAIPVPAHWMLFSISTILTGEHQQGFYSHLTVIEFKSFEDSGCERKNKNPHGAIFLNLMFKEGVGAQKRL